MRVLILTQHYVPEITAARFRLQAFAERAAARGHEVEVICPVPNHPQGVIHAAYRGRPLVRRRLNGVRVSYVWVRTSPRKTFRSRVAYYGTYAGLAAILGAAVRRPDVILASSPPLPVGAAGAIAAARHRAPWILDVRDLWPDVAVSLGELTGRRSIRLSRRLERALYERASRIVTVTEAFRRDIASKTSSPSKIEVIPNGTTQTWLDAGEADVDRSALGLPRDRFVWTFAGNVGTAQGMEGVVQAARLLGEGFVLLIIGEGPLRERVQEMAADLPENVVFCDLMPAQLAASHLRASDALLVPLRPGLTDFVPSKLFDCCAVGRPVIVAAEGEAARVAETASAAVVVPPGSPEALASAVRRLRDDPALREQLGERGRAFAGAHLRERQADRLVDLMQELVAGADGRRGRERGGR